MELFAGKEAKVECLECLHKLSILDNFGLRFDIIML